jgi:hypothetical protein
MHLVEILPNHLDAIVEMANLPSQDTGLVSGHIYISSQQGNHGCRIKYYPNIKDQSKSLSVSIPDFQIVEDTTGKAISSRTKKLVVAYAIINQDKILYFWNHGNTLDRHELNSFLDTLQKLTDEDYKRVEQLKFKN